MNTKNISSKVKLRLYIIYSPILSIIATSFSIAALCITCPRIIGENKGISLGFDYLGVIVGVLSILVALLLGWQIFYSIDTKNRIAKIESLQTSLNEQLRLAKKRNLQAETETKYHISRMQGLSLFDKQPYTAYMAFFNALTVSLSIDGEHVDNSLNDLRGVIHTIKSESLSKVNAIDMEKIKDLTPERLNEHKPYKYIYENYLDIYRNIMDCINKMEKSNKIE